MMPRIATSPFARNRILASRIPASRIPANPSPTTANRQQNPPILRQNRKAALLCRRKMPHSMYWGRCLSFACLRRSGRGLQTRKIFRIVFTVHSLYTWIVVFCTVFLLLHCNLAPSWDITFDQKTLFCKPWLCFKSATNDPGNDFQPPTCATPNSKFRSCEQYIYMCVCVPLSQKGAFENFGQENMLTYIHRTN